MCENLARQQQQKHQQWGILEYLCVIVYFCVFYLWLLICITSAARATFFGQHGDFN